LGRRRKKVHLEHIHTFFSLYNRLLFSVTFVHSSFSRKVSTILTQCLLGVMSTPKSDVAVIVHGVNVCFGWKFVLKNCTKCNSWLLQSANLSTEQTTTANKHKQLKNNACFNEAISLSFQMVDFWTNCGLKVNQVNH